MNTVIQGDGSGVVLRILTTTNDDASTYDNANIVLNDGEPFYDKVSGKLFIGDGVTTISNLKPVGTTLLTQISQQYTAKHTYSNNIHTFSIEQEVPQTSTLLPVVVRYERSYSAQQACVIKFRFVDSSSDTSITIPSASVKMTNGEPAVTNTFYNGTVGEFYAFLSGSNTAELYFPSATAVWAN